MSQSANNQTSLQGHGIRLVNSSEYGLTSGLQSLDESEQLLWKNSIEAGNLYINRGITGAIVNRQPFGGMKRSAFGGGIKAGGPNYVSCFINITEKPLEGATSKASHALAAILNSDDKARFNKAVESYQLNMDKLIKHLSKVTYPKGFLILEAGKVETNVFFLEKGIARAYIPVDGKEITFWIGKEGATIVSLKSYVSNQQGYETMELMEDSTLYVLKRSDLYELFKEDIHIANWGRKFAELEFLQTEERLIPLLFTTASERYKILLENNPDLLQRMPLECLASYLGITPVSLSRIRAKLK